MSSQPRMATKVQGTEAEVEAYRRSFLPEQVLVCRVFLIVFVSYFSVMVDEWTLMRDSMTHVFHFINAVLCIYLIERARVGVTISRYAPVMLYVLSTVVDIVNIFIVIAWKVAGFDDASSLMSEAGASTGFFVYRVLVTVTYLALDTAGLYLLFKGVPNAINFENRKLAAGIE